MSAGLMEYFNKQPRLGTLSTSGKDGKVDVAYFGSPRMVDEKTVVIALGNNRSLANLRENPHAVFMIMEPGQAITEWKGVRVYMTMKDCQTSGPGLEQLRAEIASFAGPDAARMIYAAATFELYEIRPFADFGQGWEKSIGLV